MQWVVKLIIWWKELTSTGSCRHCPSKLGGCPCRACGKSQLISPALIGVLDNDKKREALFKKIFKKRS